MGLIAAVRKFFGPRHLLKADALVEVRTPLLTFTTCVWCGKPIDLFAPETAYEQRPMECLDMTYQVPTGRYWCNRDCVLRSQES